MRPTRKTTAPVRQQIVVSGVGGQGVLFIARLLADAAIAMGLPVLTSETHGMAQRGGVVVAHVKVGDFASPLVRAGRADGLIVLKEENLAVHRAFLEPSGWIVENAPGPPGPEPAGTLHAVDADALAQGAGVHRAANLVVLGFAASRSGGRNGGGILFCTIEHVRASLERRLAGQGALLDASLRAFDLGTLHGKG